MNTVRHRMNSNDFKSRSTACTSQHVIKWSDYQFVWSSIMSSRFILSYAMMNKNEFYHASSTLRTRLDEENNVVTNATPAQDDRLMGRASKYCYIPGRTNAQNICKFILSLIQISEKHTSARTIATITPLIVPYMVGEFYLRKLHHPDPFLTASCPHYCVQIIKVLKSILAAILPLKPIFSNWAKWCSHNSLSRIAWIFYARLPSFNGQRRKRITLLHKVWQRTTQCISLD